MRTTVETVYADRAVPLAQLAEINRLMMRNRLVLMDALLHPVADSANRVNTEVGANSEAISGLLKAYLATRLTDEESRLAQELVSARDTYRTVGLGPALSALKAGDLEAAKSLHEKQVVPTGQQVEEKIRLLVTASLAARARSPTSSAPSTALPSRPTSWR